MSLDLEERIKNARMTKTERQIADFFLDNRGSLYFMTSKDIALALHVSDTSVIRLCRTLGYSGFKDLQQRLQKDLSEALDNDKYVLPYQKLPEKTETSKDIGSFQFLEKRSLVGQLTALEDAGNILLILFFRRKKSFGDKYLAHD